MARSSWGLGHMEGWGLPLQTPRYRGPAGWKHLSLHLLSDVLRCCVSHGVSV